MIPRRALLAAALVPAQAPDRFADTVGLNTHLESPPYRDRTDDLLALLRRLGIRHLRDELRPGNDWPNWRRLAEGAGLRFDLLVSPATNTPADLLAALKAVGPANVAAVEGQNEGDSPWFTARHADWAETVIAYQRATFAALRAAGSRLPVLSPTVLDYKPADMARLRPAAAFCDAVALHAYVQGQQEPETADDDAALAWYRRRVAAPFKPGAPVFVTEAGYTTPAGGVPPEIVARYLPRLLLHNAAAGIVRTYLYELLDEGTDGRDTEQNWGLLTSELRPKPAFETVRLLLATLGPARAAAAMPLASPVADLRQAAFVAPDGTRLLALWRAAPGWDRVRREVRTVAAVPVAVPPGAEALRLAPGQEWRRAGARVAADDVVTVLRWT